MTTQKKARSAVGAATAGEDLNTREGEPIMDQDTTTPEHSATDVAEALRLIDEGHAHVIDLEPSDALYQDIADAFTKPLDWVEEADESKWLHMAYPVDGEGRYVKLPGGDWWVRHIMHLDPGAVRYWQTHPNSAIHVGELLVISLGEYQYVGRTETEDGPVAEFITFDEARRRRDEAKDAWTETNLAAIIAAQPAQATSWDVWDFAEWSDSQGVMYEHEIGPVTIAWTADAQDGVVTVKGLEVQVRVGDKSEMIGGVDEMRELAAALMAAIPVIEEATL